MHEGTQPDKVRRTRYAERKLKGARQRLALTERGIVKWFRILAGLKHERTLAVQPVLLLEEEANKKNWADKTESLCQPRSVLQNCRLLGCGSLLCRPPLLYGLGDPLPPLRREMSLLLPLSRLRGGG